MKKLPLQNIVTDDHARAIGLVVAQWAFLERLLGLYLCALTSGKATWSTEEMSPLFLVTGMDGRTLIGLLKTLVRYRFEDHADNFDKEIAAELEKVKKSRDNIAHSAWQESKKPGAISPLGLKTVGSVKIAKGDLTAKDIEFIAWEIYGAGMKLKEFMTARNLTPPGLFQ